MNVKESSKLVTVKKGYLSKAFLLENLITDEFIKQTTDLNCTDDFFKTLEFSNQEEFDNLDVSLFDNLVQKHSSLYHSWTDFLQAAVNQHQSQL